MRVIDALQLAEVLNGSKWIALPLPNGMILPQQTIGVADQGRAQRRMYWCDRYYDPRAWKPSHFGTEATLSLPQLLGECTLVDATLDTR